MTMFGVKSPKLVKFQNKLAVFRIAQKFGFQSRVSLNKEDVVTSGKINITLPVTVVLDAAQLRPSLNLVTAA